MIENQSEDTGQHRAAECHAENIPLGQNNLLRSSGQFTEDSLKPKKIPFNANSLEDNKPKETVDVLVTQMSAPPSPILLTEHNLLKTDRAADKDMDFSDAEEKFDLLKVPNFRGDNTVQNKPLCENKFTFVKTSTTRDDDIIIRQESFESIAEEPEYAQKKSFPFQETKRKANCCSLFTYWYVNTLVDSVELNNGKMDALFIENMNSDPKRDERLLHKFQLRLGLNLDAWKRKNPNSSEPDAAQWCSFTKRAIRSTVGMQFFQVAFIAFVAEICTLYSIYMIKFLAEYLLKEESELQRSTVLVVTFTLSLIISALLRNFYIYYGYVMSLEVRKMLISALYDKINKLSMRSLTETN